MQKMNFIFGGVVKRHKKQNFPLVFTLFGQLKVQFILQLSNETSENCRTKFSWYVTTT